MTLMFLTDVSFKKNILSFPFYVYMFVAMFIESAWACIFRARERGVKS